MKEQDGTEVLAGLLTAALLLVVVAVVAFVPADPAYLHARFTAEHIQQLNMHDSRGQQWAHRSALMLVGILGIGLWLLRPIEFPRFSSRTVLLTAGILSRNGGILIIALVVAFVVLRLGNPPETTYWLFQGRYGLTPLLSVEANGVLLALGLVATCAYVALVHRQTNVIRYIILAALGTCVVLLYLGIAPRRGVLLALGLLATCAYLAPVPRYTKAIRYIIPAVLGTYVAALLYLGIASQPEFAGFSPGLLASVESHYSGTLGPADRIAAGQHLDEVSTHYGLLPTVLLGIWQQISGVLDFGGHIRLIAVLQGLALVAALIGYGAWYSGRAAPWIVAGLLVLPWMQPLHVAVLYPNQSAWRFLVFCLGVVILAALHARPARVLAPVLGFMAGAALLWNPETGICLSISYLVFLVLRNAGTALLHFFAGLLAALGGFLLLVRAGLGYWPDTGALLSSYAMMGSFAKGYGGLRLGPGDPLAALVFVHALFVLMRGLLDWGRSAVIEPRQHCRIALAALLVLWAAYYFNRPDPWNLWSFLFLYGFLVGDLLPRRDADARSWTASRLVRAPSLAALAVIVLPSLLAMNALTVLAMDLAIREPACAPDNVISGTCVPRPAAILLTKKAESLREQASRRPILYFTSDVYLMPLMTGLVQPRVPRDPYSESNLKSDLDRLAQRILELRPACALFDDPQSRLSGTPHHRSFYGRLRTAIAPVYERSQSDGGWEVWCLKKT